MPMWTAAGIAIDLDGAVTLQKSYFVVGYQWSAHINASNLSLKENAKMIDVASPKRPIGHPERALDCEQALSPAIAQLAEDDTLGEEEIETKLVGAGLEAGWEEDELRTAIADLRRSAALGLQGLPE
jgi:hypothetical protein